MIVTLGNNDINRKSIPTDQKKLQKYNHGYWKNTKQKKKKSNPKMRKNLNKFKPKRTKIWIWFHIILKWL